MLHETIDTTIENLNKLKSDGALIDTVDKAIAQIVEALVSGKPLMVCGNGGSSADALHITGELVGRFNLNRPAMNVICLNANVTILTAWANDVGFESVFSRQVEAHAQTGAVLWGLSTSGNSPNMLAAFEVARQHGVRTIGMTGEGGGKLRNLSDILIASPGKDAPSSQNMHVMLYHYMCQEIERMVLKKS
jgi:D-sedoheptulose 7-phosphate isomerase